MNDEYQTRGFWDSLSTDEKASYEKLKVALKLPVVMDCASTLSRVITDANKIHNGFRGFNYAIFDPDNEVIDLISKYIELINNPRIGTVSKIEVNIQDVGEYELKLVLSLKDGNT